MICMRNLIKLQRRQQMNLQKL